MDFTGTDQNGHFCLLLFKIWFYLWASSSSASCHPHSWALFQVFLKSLVTAPTPRVLPTAGIFLHQGLGLLLEVPTLPSARGWLALGGNNQILSELNSHVLWHRKAEQSCPYTQPRAVELMELSKIRWKYQSTAFCQGSESSQCGIVKIRWKYKSTAFCRGSESSHRQSSIPPTAVLSLLLPESLSLSIRPKLTFSAQPFSPFWGVPFHPHSGQQFVAPARCLPLEKLTA